MDNELFKRMKNVFFPKEAQHKEMKAVLTPEVERAIHAQQTEKKRKRHRGTGTESLIRDMQVLNGIPPHDVSSNYCQGDGYFANDLGKRLKAAGKTYEEVFELAKARGRLIKPSWDRR